MRLTSTLFSLAMLSHFVVASPLEARRTRVVAVGREIEDGENTGTVSKRTDFNALDKRADPLLFIYTAANCGSTALKFSLNVQSFQCYPTGTVFNSVYLPSDPNLTFNVLVGTGCTNDPISALNTCQNISPSGNTFSID